MNTNLRYLQDSGSANVWINFAKLLIGLTVSSQMILQTQLGFDPLSNQPVMLTLRCPDCEQAFNLVSAPHAEIGHNQTITAGHDEFTISFVPISANKFTGLTLVVESQGKFRRTPKDTWRTIATHERRDAIPIPTGTSIESRNAVYIRPFRLSDMLGTPEDKIEAGDYCLRYHLNFGFGKHDRDANEVGFVYLTYLKTPLNQYGDFPIALYERLGFPSDLNNRALDSPKIYKKRLTPTETLTPAPDVNITIDNIKHEFFAQKLPSYDSLPQEWHRNYYELRTSYPDPDTKLPVPVSVTFVLRKPEPPRPNFDQPTLPNGVLLYYNKDFYDTSNESEYYWYCPLHRYISDPDGFTADGKHTLIPHNITIDYGHAQSQNDTNYTLIPPEKNPDHIWRLKVINEASVANGDVIFLSVDDYWQGRSGIKILIKVQ